jgi:hypothetical protein
MQRASSPINLNRLITAESSAFDASNFVSSIQQAPNRVFGNATLDVDGTRAIGWLSGRLRRANVADS